MKTPFGGRVLVLGCGGVAQCALPLILQHVDMPRNRITVLDSVDQRDKISAAREAGVRFVLEEIMRFRFERQLEQYAGRGDLIVDLAWDIGCTDLLEWCHRRGVLYLNTSVELWDPEAQKERAPTVERTLYQRQMAIRALIRTWPDQPGPTAILDHGANPGLISHFTKMALIDLSESLLQRNPDDLRRRSIEQALADAAFAQLARLSGVRAIHVSERDTQTALRPKEPEEFVNTWSIEGFYEEGTAPAEIGWGTHERTLPADARLHEDQGPRHQICLKRFGMNTFVKSRVPSAEIVGMVIRHGEAFSIAEALTLTDDDRVAYRPTVHYAYCPCEAAWESLAELRSRDYELQPRRRIMTDEIVSGFDELGCLVMGHDFQSWWTGTRLDIDESRRLVPGQNATTLQVAAAVVAAICWIVEHPQRGVLLPDHLPHDDIMNIARPYLGEIISQPLDWMPDDAYPPDSDEAWQFDRFLLDVPQPATQI